MGTIGDQGGSGVGTRFRVLGAIEVERDGVTLPLGGPQQRRLLGVLLTDPGRVVPLARISEALWSDGDPPDADWRTVRTYASRLRKVIGDRLVTREPGYLVDVDGAEVDHVRFDSLVKTASGQAPSLALATLEEALGLWRGAPFAEFSDEWWARPDVARLDELHLRALEQRFAAMSALGRDAEILGDLGRLSGEHPLREQFVAQLMTALYRTGREAEAHRAYQRYRAHLVETTGLDPSPRLTELDRSISRGIARTPDGRRARTYVFQDQLGQGSFGTVHRAVQSDLGREVAVKALRRELADDPGFVRRFETEAQMIARLEHPNIVPLYDYWREPGGAFLVFRLLRTGADQRVATSGPLALADVDRTVRDVGAALAFAHRAGIVHRDVKPSNILYDDDGNAYLGDFGIAVPEGPGVAPTGADRRYGLARSPEQARHGTASARTDQFGLAATAWELLTGRSVLDAFGSASPDRPVVGALTSVRPQRPDVPSAVDHVLQRAGRADPEERFTSVAEFVEAWCRALGGQPPAAAEATPVNPYKGLRAFGEADAAAFFGRQASVDQLAQAVAANPFTAVIGPSGSGKTSLLLAGLVPRLRADPRLLLVTMSPGPQPVQALGAALGAVAPLGVSLDPGALAGAEGLSDAVSAVLGADADRLVIVIDQLEHLWSLAPVSERVAFVDALTGAVDRQRGRLRAVSAIRADWLDRPLQDHALGPLVAAGAVHLTPMRTADVHETIVAPATAAGLTAEPALVARLVADLGTDAPSLPLLQFALTELVERRTSSTITLADYERIGGLAGALAGRADAAVASLDAEQQQAVRTMFGRLVLIGDGAPDSRRRVRRADLAAVPDAVIDDLSAARLLTLDHDPVTRDSTVELAHDALLQHWPTLRRWLDEDRADLLATQRITDSALAWRRSGEDRGELLRGGRLQEALEVSARAELGPDAAAFVEASRAASELEHHRAVRARRRLQQLVALVAVALVLAVAAGVLAWAQRDRARQSAGRATEAAASAETSRLAATAASLAVSDAPVADLLAVEVARRDGPDSNLPAATLERVLAAKPRYLGSLPTVGEYAFSADGRALVARTSTGVEAYDLDTRRLVASAAHPMGAGIPGRRLAVTDAGIVVETSGDADVRRWQLPGLAELPALRTLSAVTSLDATGSGRIFAGHADGTVEAWDAAAGTRVASLSAGDKVTRLSASADGAVLAVGTTAAVEVVRVPSGERVAELPAADPLDVALSPDGKTVVVTTQLFETLSFDVVSGAKVATLPPGVLFARFVDDSHVALSQGSQVSVVDARSGAPGRTVATTCGCDFALSRDGRMVASGLAAPGVYTLGDDGPLGQAIGAPASAPVGGLVEVARSGDGLLSVGWTLGGIEVLAPDGAGWRVVRQEPSDSFGGLVGDGDLLRFTFEHGSLVDPRSGAVKADFAGVGPSASFAATADGRWVAFGRPDGSVAVVDTTAGGAPRVLTDLQAANQGNGAPFTAVVGGVRFSPDGRWLAASSWSGAAGVWPVGDWSAFRLLTPGVVDVNGASKPAFDPSGGRLALSYGRRGMRLFDTSTWQQVGELSFGTLGLPMQAAFAPSGTRLTVVFDTAQALTYDVGTGRQVGAPLPAAPLATPLYLDGTTLALVRPDAPSVVVWHLDPAAMVAEACREAGRNLTREEWATVGPRDEPYRLTCPQFPAPDADPTRSREIAPATSTRPGA